MATINGKEYGYILHTAFEVDMDFDTMEDLINWYRDLFDEAGIMRSRKPSIQIYGMDADSGIDFEEEIDDLECYAPDELENDFAEAIEDLQKKEYKHPMNSKLLADVFVYGTLKKDQHANIMLGDSEYVGKFVLPGYAMYDLGVYPGIVECAGESVEGEVYRVKPELMPAIDQYEGEGHLYNRKEVTVYNRYRREKKVQAYVYNGDPGDILMREPWGASGDDTVWYAAYGSNLDEERFSYYIKGGEYRGKAYEGCSDRSLWQETRVEFYPGEMYYGNSSSRWENGGVAFYDPDKKDCSALMKLYKIKRSQLNDIRQQEGPSFNWYGRIYCLEMIGDEPVYTLTSESRRPENSPCDEYRRFIEDSRKKVLDSSIERWFSGWSNALVDEEKVGEKQDLTLSRCDAFDFDLRAASLAKAQLDYLLKEHAYNTADIRMILDFQDDDGSFRLFTKYEGRGETVVDYCNEPTYICVAILMHALVHAGEKGIDDDLRVRIEESLKRALEVCVHHEYGRLDFGGPQEHTASLKYFYSGDVLAFLKKYPDMDPEFESLVRKLLENFQERLITGNTRVGAWGDNYEWAMRRCVIMYEKWLA